MKNFLKIKRSVSAAFLVVVFLLGGCGRKGDPVPPEAAFTVYSGLTHQDTGRGLSNA
ncbi:MAG: LPS translocon maturation chaperone LptM [Nitrospiria bacterium]